MILRARGIYRLPNGRKLVVIEKHENAHILYRLGGWEQFELTEYEVNHDGRLVSQGKLTAWGIADLSDTGQTAGPFAHPLESRL